MFFSTPYGLRSICLTSDASKFFFQCVLHPNLRDLAVHYFWSFFLISFLLFLPTHLIVVLPPIARSLPPFIYNNPLRGAILSLFDSPKPVLRCLVWVAASGTLPLHPRPRLPNVALDALGSCSFTAFACNRSPLSAYFSPHSGCLPACPQVSHSLVVVWDRPLRVA